MPGVTACAARVLDAPRETEVMVSTLDVCAGDVLLAAPGSARCGLVICVGEVALPAAAMRGDDLWRTGASA
jgi:hypothetical protein